MKRYSGLSTRFLAKKLHKSNKEKEKKYRFFYHYYKQYNEMSVHFRDKCYRTKNVICEVPSETHWNKSQPNLIMRGFATEIIEEDGRILIR